MHKKAVLLIGLVLVLTSVAYADDFPQAPRFTSKSVDNEVVVLDSLLGKGPIVITFWATWCKFCAVELDRLRDIYEELEKDGLEVLAINQDGPRTIAKVKPFAAGRKWEYPILLDPEKKVARLYAVWAIPHLFVLDEEGKIRLTHRGFRPGDEVLLKKEIQKLMPPEESEEEEGGEKEERE